MHAILFHWKHHVVELFPRNEHKINQYEGTEHVKTLSKTQQFWIIGQINALGSVKNKFITCRRGKAQTIDPVMPYPPTERLDALTLFAYIRVDYFGPFTVKFGHRNEKGRCFLFSSLTVRAVDVEIVPKLDLAVHSSKRQSGNNN